MIHSGPNPLSESKQVLFPRRRCLLALQYLGESSLLNEGRINGHQFRGSVGCVYHRWRDKWEMYRGLVTMHTVCVTLSAGGSEGPLCCVRYSQSSSAVSGEEATLDWWGRILYKIEGQDCL